MRTKFIVESQTFNISIIYRTTVNDGVHLVYGMLIRCYRWTPERVVL
ncbi:hypothetical protein SAMN04487948_101198 [Halogranum amylolyticum]|uniref:Uncharacterized protein n=1 Tax=Halogranum amylolyticum TaxID=660520 RepID=A0A1H8MZ74_9EURY|nr:hypothetical protein SAMN04487948_101198 [Halogranum amylolyticum]